MKALAEKPVPSRSNETECDPNNDFVKGQFVFKDYKARSKNNSDFLSDQIIVENCLYALSITPNGWDSGKNTHISVGIRRTHLASLKSN